MKQIILTVPDEFPMINLVSMLRQGGFVLRLRGDGHLTGEYPHDINERHGNANVVRMPHHKRQLHKARLPEPPSTGPDAA